MKNLKIKKRKKLKKIKKNSGWNFPKQSQLDKLMLEEKQFYGIFE